MHCPPGRGIQLLHSASALPCLLACSCKNCKKGWENYCHTPVYTYNSRDADGTMTMGGYSSHVVVDRK